MAPHLPGKHGDPGGSGADNRLFAEAVLWLSNSFLSMCGAWARAPLHEGRGSMAPSQEKRNNFRHAVG
jgi:hypothetical protein